MSRQRAGRGAYAGLRVLDFTHVLAGPWCTKFLADHGADVIKVESPAGDMTRYFPHELEPGTSTQFVQYNAGKRSVVINLRAPRGVEIARQLAAAVDVVVENFRPGVFERLGLAAEDLRRENPGLIVCSISTFGRGNALSSTPGYGFVAEAHSGLMELASDERDPPGSFGTALSDLTSAVHAFGAIGAALYRRERTGDGTIIDVASYEAMVATIDHALVLHNFTKGAETYGAYRRRHGTIVPTGVLVAADGGYVTYTANNDAHWEALLGLIGRPELIGDTRYATGIARKQAREEVYEIVESWGPTIVDAATIVELLGSVGIPAARVRPHQEVAEDPHLVDRGVLAPVTLPNREPVNIPVAPHHLHNAPVTNAGPPPRLGEHTREVLSGSLGLDDTQIDELLATGVVGEPGAAPANATETESA